MILMLYNFVAIRCSASSLPKNMATRNNEFANYSGKVVTFTCKTGFSFNEDHFNDTARTVHCRADGMLEPVNLPYCKRKYPSMYCSCVCNKSRPSCQQFFCHATTRAKRVFIFSWKNCTGFR